MSSFYCRHRFHLLEGDSIAIDEEEFVLHQSPDGVQFKLKSGAKGSPIRALPRVAVVAGPFGSEELAKQAGLSVRRVLVAWAISKRFALDLGGTKPSGGFTPAGLQALEAELNQPVRNDVHGLDVYPADPDRRTAFVSWPMRVGLSVGPTAFANQIAVLLQAPPDFPDKVGLASELFLSSSFETSSKARFLTLVTAVEALLEPAERSTLVSDFVEATQERLSQLGADKDLTQALHGSIEALKRESIGQAGRALAERVLPDTTYADMAAPRFFSYLYGIRSKLVHTGRLPFPEFDLLALANNTSAFVGDLLERLLRRDREGTG